MRLVEICLHLYRGTLSIAQTARTLLYILGEILTKSHFIGLFFMLGNEFGRMHKIFMVLGFITQN